MSMRFPRAQRALFLCGPAALVLFLGCGGGGGTQPAPDETAPIITTQPLDQEVNEGTTATLSVAASGKTPLTYQWKRGGADVAGATQASYTTPALSPDDDGVQYTVLVSNSHGSRLSAAATLRVKRRPTITTQPVSVTVTEGQTATFTVVASGATTYQWFRNGTVIAGATQASYTTPAAVLSDSGAQFRVMAANTAGSATSSTATLTVLASAVAPTITGQPSAATITEGQPASFTVTATGTAPLSYQWYKGATPVSGATQATLAFAAAQASDAGIYKVAVSNSVGSVESSSATLTVNVPVSITVAPAPQTVTVGQTATFTVTAAGTGPFAYQWQKDTVDLAGQTTATLSLANVQATDAGSYRVVVTGATGSVTSDAATLTVHPASSLGISTQPASATVTVPDPAVFTVAATGSNLTYQWKRDGVDIPGATQATYTTPPTSLSPADPNPTATYAVVVSDGTQSVTSQNATFAQQQPDPAYAGDPVSTAGHSLLSLEYTPLYSSRGAFRVGYDEGLMNPRWTTYCTYKVATPLPDQGSRDYRPDTRTSTQVKDSDFNTLVTGYTRGHQALMSDLELRYGAQAGTDSCYTTNLAPQKEAHNNNFWQVIEQAVSGAWNGSAWTQPGVFGSANRLWISTGPTFSGDPARTVGKGMAIPNGFYKVVVREIGGVPQALALLTPHEPVPANADVWKYVTSVARVEEVTGINLYPNLPAQAPVDFKTTVDVRGWGAPFEATTKPNVHMVRPSWDITVPAGTTVTFDGAATRSGGTIASTTWSFGDGATATGTSTAYAYTTGGTYTVTFTATDDLGVSNSITRVITVTGSTGNPAPVIGPIGAQSTTVDVAKSVTLGISGDSTAVSLLTVNATSSNETVLPNSGIVPSWNGTAWVLTLTPAAGQTGSATVTVTAQNGDGATGSQAFTFSVSSSSGTGALIISQYYEGANNDKWIELTNVGSGDASLTGIYLAVLANANADAPEGKTPNQWDLLTTVLSGQSTLAPGASLLFKHSSAALPAYATGVASNAAGGFSGDDIVFLTTTNTTTAWANRIDVIGNGNTWGSNTSFYRNPGIAGPNTTYTPAEWTQATNAAVDSAAAGTSERLGEHH